MGLVNKVAKKKEWLDEALALAQADRLDGRRSPLASPSRQC